MIAGTQLTVQVWLGAFSVIDVGKAAVAKLNSIQRRWLELIRKTPAYAPLVAFAVYDADVVPMDEANSAYRL